MNVIKIIDELMIFVRFVICKPITEVSRNIPKNIPKVIKGTTYTET